MNCMMLFHMSILAVLHDLRVVHLHLSRHSCTNCMMLICARVVPIYLHAC